MRSVIATVVLWVLCGVAFAGSETPPEGPTWERDLIAAQDKALTQGVPLFLYFTKTY